MGQDPNRGVQGFDLAGALAVTAGLSLLVYGLSNGQAWEWSSPQTIGLLGASVALLAAFVAIEHPQPSPLIRLGIFRIRSLAVGNAGFLLTSSGMYGAFYFSSLYVQDVLGYNPLRSGLSLLPLTIGVLIGAGAAQALLECVGPRLTAVSGSAFAAGGMLLLIRMAAAGQYASTVLPGLLVLAVGLGLAMVPFTLLATGGVSEAESGLATGIDTASSYVGGAVGLAVLTAIAAANPAHLGGRAALVSGYHVAYMGAAILLAAPVPLLAVPCRPARAPDRPHPAAGD